jgi:plastocyanin
MSSRLRLAGANIRGAILAGDLCGLAAVSASAPAAAATLTIQITSQNQFVPATVHVKAGDTVVWSNISLNPRDVTPDPGQEGALSASGVIAPGATYTVTISGPPRTIKYYNKFHGAPGGLGESGQIVVDP